MRLISLCSLIAHLTAFFFGQAVAQDESRIIQFVVYGGPSSNSVNGRFENSLRDANLDAQVCLFGCLQYPVSQTGGGVLASFRVKVGAPFNGARLWAGADVAVNRTGHASGRHESLHRVSLTHSARTVAPMISVSTSSGLVRFGVGASIGQYRVRVDPDRSSSISETSWKQARAGFVGEVGVAYAFGKAGRLLVGLVVQYRATGELTVGPFELTDALADQPIFPVSGFNVNFSHWFGGLGIGVSL